ncbi:MAG: hypothetical protein ACYC4K_09830, partial [Thiobacillus sp.]
MTLATGSTNNTATLSGRELALNRRKAMALHGKTAVAKSAKIKAAAPRYSPAASAQPASRPAASTSMPRTPSPVLPAPEINKGREASRARRQALSTSGKAAVNKLSDARPAGRMRPQGSNQPAPAMAESAYKSCGCGCNGTKTSCDTGSSDSL